MSTSQPVPFLWVDVFAETQLEGNPLAVLDGALVPEELLLKLTREMNQSETAFYYPPTEAGADARVRIFTLAKEVKFAGHPTLGTAVALCLSGRVPYRGPATQVRLQLGIGVVTVTVMGDEAPERARFEHAQVGLCGGEITDERLLWVGPALGVPRGRIGADLGSRRLWPQVVSGGAKQLLVPLLKPSDVEQIVANPPDVLAAERAVGAELGMLAFAFTEAPGDETRPVRVRARFFAYDAPQEDPATGSAAGALAVYLHHHGLLRAGQVVEIDQGPIYRFVDTVPGRRGLLKAAFDGTTVSVEGRVREVGRGEVRLG